VRTEFPPRFGALDKSDVLGEGDLAAPLEIAGLNKPGLVLERRDPLLSGSQKIGKAIGRATSTCHAHSSPTRGCDRGLKGA